MNTMATIHLTETQLARDLHGVLDKVRHGIEVVVEEDSHPVALIKTPSRLGRTLSECIALAKAEEKKFAQPPVPDQDFAADVRAAVAVHGEPLEPTAWD
jgi:antitoxin (DNA-binding transcriptional repressor) of toxin-antitoxin stability system